MRYIISLGLASLALPVALPAMADVPKVVTDLPAVQSLAALVMAGAGEPVLLLDRGADPHSFQLRPSQAADLAEADLVLWIGPEMTPWLERSLRSLGAGAAQLALLDAPGTRTRAYGGSQGHDDHGGEAEGEADGGHAHDGADPHAWLDPTNAVLWTGLIAAELSRIDPDNSGLYAANAAAARARIEALDATIAARMAPFAATPFVTFHDAYGYFTDHYGLARAEAIALGDASSPGASRLVALRGHVAQNGAICIFPEGQHDPALAVQLADGTAARIGPALDPEGALVEPGAGAYEAILTRLADALTACLGQ